MEGPTDKETTTPPEELEQSVTSELSDHASDEVRRGQRTRTMTDKARENKITALTNSFWKLHGKFAREIIQTETTLAKFCTKDTLGEMEVNVMQRLQEFEHIYEEMTMLSTAASDQTILLAIDRATAGKDLLVAAITLRMRDQHTKQSTTHSHRSSSNRTSSLRRLRIDAEANAAAYMVELEALKEADMKEEQLFHLEMAETARRAEAEAELKRQRRAIEQQRLEKLLRMAEAKVSVCRRNKPGIESKQSNLFVRKTLRPTKTDSKSILGWSIVGRTDLHEDGDATETTHQIVVKQIHDQLQPDTGQDLHHHEVRFVTKTSIKEVIDIPPKEIVPILESDFKDGSSCDKHMSQDDMLFLEKIGSGIHHQRDGHYSMPFSSRIHPNMSNNRNVAVRRFSHLKRRFKSDKKYSEDYKGYMEEMMERGDAEKIPPDELFNEPAKKLIKEARHMYAKGNLRLDQFVSNSREVIEINPCSERAR